MSFAQDIAAFRKKTGLRMDTIVRKVVIDMSSAIIARSPVDTGRFKGNWMPGVDRIDDSTFDLAKDTQGRASTVRIAIAMKNVKAGGIVYVTNSLPYAIPLEYGHSQQAPAGMVRLTVAEYQTYIHNAVKTVQEQ